MILTLRVEKLNEQGMVLDFSELKNAVGNWIEQTIDHKMVLCKDDPLVPLLQAQGEPLYLMDENPTAENFARLFFELAKSLNFPVCRVQFWETEKCQAEYESE